MDNKKKQKAIVLMVLLMVLLISVLSLFFMKGSAQEVEASPASLLAPVPEGVEIEADASYLDIPSESDDRDISLFPEVDIEQEGKEDSTADSLEIDKEIKAIIDQAKKQDRVHQLEKQLAEYKELYENGVEERNRIIKKKKEEDPNESYESSLLTEKTTTLPRPTVSVGNDGVVSSLTPPGNPTNSFYSAVDYPSAQQGNAILAQIERDVEVKDGDIVRLRLKDPINIQGMRVPAGKDISAKISFSQSRMMFTVTSILVGNNIVPVKLIGYDLNGQEGVEVQGSSSAEVKNTIRQSVGQGVQTAGQNTFSFNQSAKDAIITETGRGIVRSLAFFISNSKSESRVRIQAGQRLYLVEQNR